MHSHASYLLRILNHCSSDPIKIRYELNFVTTPTPNSGAMPLVYKPGILHLVQLNFRHILLKSQLRKTPINDWK